jgi:hypothetical protein
MNFSGTIFQNSFSGFQNTLRLIFQTKRLIALQKNNFFSENLNKPTIVAVMNIKISDKIVYITF